MTPATSLRPRQLARAAGMVMVLFVVSRLTGLTRELIIGARFGTSAELDAYLAAFRLPDIIFQLLAGGALASAFLPTFSGCLVEGDQEGADRLASSIINLLLILLTILAVLTALLAPLLVRHIIAPGFTPEQQALTVMLMRGLLISTIVFGVSGVVMAMLNARQHFLMPALAPATYNLAIIAGAWFLAPQWGARGLVLGVVIGAAGHLAVQLPQVARARVWRWRPVLGLRDVGVREVARLMGPRVLGLAAVQINFLINTILASNLPAGSLAALNYAWLLMLLPQGIIAQAIATAAFPTFSVLSNRGEIDELRSLLSSTLRAIIFLALPAAVGLLVLRAPLVRLLLQRGEFDAHSTRLVAYALALFALGLVAHSVVEIMSRAFYALHDTRTPVTIAIVAMAANVVLSLMLVGPLRHGGLALANSIATTGEMMALLWLMRERLKGLDGKRLGMSVMRVGSACALMAMVLLGWLRGMGGASALVVAGGGMVLGATTFLGAAFLLQAEELQQVPALFRRVEPST